MVFGYEKWYLQKWHEHESKMLAIIYFHSILRLVLTLLKQPSLGNMKQDPTKEPIKTT